MGKGGGMAGGWVNKGPLNSLRVWLQRCRYVIPNFPPPLPPFFFRGPVLPSLCTPIHAKSDILCVCVCVCVYLCMLTLLLRAHTHTHTQSLSLSPPGLVQGTRGGGKRAMSHT